jgi:Putative  PD-(D/E)XK family member, (DUF4420)
LNADVLRALFRRLSEEADFSSGAAFAALSIPGSGGHMASVSREGRPGLLLRTVEQGSRPTDIRLSGLNATFGVTCNVSLAQAPPEEHRISILECTADGDLVPIFAETGGTFLRLLGPEPTMAEAARAVAHFASIFSALARPSRQSVTGLIGELMLLLLCSDPVPAVQCWRVSPVESFDFVALDARVEAKATSTGLRIHSFSWEQCNPPDGPALIASFRVERAGGGMTLRTLIDRIEARLHAAPEAAARLRETIASTMGQTLPQVLDISFDEVLCRASLQWFDLREVPAIRGDLPAGVGSLRFMSDVSQATAISPSLLFTTRLAPLIPQA